MRKKKKLKWQWRREKGMGLLGEMDRGREIRRHRWWERDLLRWEKGWERVRDEPEALGRGTVVIEMKRRRNISVLNKLRKSPRGGERNRKKRVTFLHPRVSGTPTIARIAPIFHQARSNGEVKGEKRREKRSASFRRCAKSHRRSN